MILFTIREAAEKCGISSYTLRYYEKIGLLPPPKRDSAGRRCYTETDLRFMWFLKSVKETGMSLEEIHEFVKDGCIMEKIHLDVPIKELTPSLNRRIEILTKHLENMEAKKKELEEVIAATKSKLDSYHSMLSEG